MANEGTDVYGRSALLTRTMHAIASRRGALRDWDQYSLLTTKLKPIPMMSLNVYSPFYEHPQPHYTLRSLVNFRVLVIYQYLCNN